MIERGMDACVWFVQVLAHGAWMFAEMLINFYFGKLLHYPYVLFIGKVMPNFSGDMTMDEHVREMLFGLCNVFDVLSRKSISMKQLEMLQGEIVMILCELEIYSPLPRSMTSWCIC
jgi:hypothetical protein